MLTVPYGTVGHTCRVDGQRGIVTAVQYEPDRTLMDVLVETPGELIEDGDGEITATIYATVKTIAIRS